MSKKISITKGNLAIKAALISGSLVALLVSSGCATSSLLDDNRVTTTSSSAKSILSQDQIIAFGRPATVLPKMPTASMVIVGEKNSYVLSQGGTEMVNLLTNLTAKNIQVENDMAFEVPNNDGYFQGQMKLSYAKLKDESLIVATISSFYKTVVKNVVQRVICVSMRSAFALRYR